MTERREFQLDLPGFHGTLEELVLRTRRDRSLLTLLPLEPLTKQLVAYLEHHGAGQPLDRRIEWLDLAALLIRWKSLLLVPAELGQAEALERELRAEIEEKFSEIERAYLQYLRDLLTERFLAAGGRLETEPQWQQFRPQPQEPPLFPSLWTLRKKFQTLRTRARDRRERQERSAQILRIHQDETSVHEMIQWLEHRLHALGPGQAITAEPLFAEAGPLPRQIALFLAMLSLTQQRKTALVQQSLEDAMLITLA